MALIQRGENECGALIRHFINDAPVDVCGFNNNVVRDGRRGFVSHGSVCEDGFQALLRCPNFRDELVGAKRAKLQEQGGYIDLENALKGARCVDHGLLDKVRVKAGGGGVQALGIADLYTVAHIGKYGIHPDTDQLSYAVGRIANLGVRVPEVRIEAPVAIIKEKPSGERRRRGKVAPEVVGTPSELRSRFVLIRGGKAVGFEDTTLI